MASTFRIPGISDLVDTLIGDASDGFARGFVLEIVDDRAPQSPETFGLVLNPTRYELSEPFQAELTPTEDNSVVAEETGIVIREIMLEGTFGLREKPGFGGANANKKLGGNEHFLAMRNFFRRYSAMKKDPNKSPHTHMALHVLKDDDHWKVVPREFTSPRDSRLARMHRLYRLQLTAIDGPNFRRFKQPHKALGFFDRVAQLSKSLNDARAFFADATAALALVRRRTVGNFDALLIQAAGIITAAGNFVRGLRQTIRVPIQLVQQTAQALELLADQVDSVTSFDPGSLDPDAYMRDFARAVRGLSSAFDDFGSHPDAFDQPLSSFLAGGGKPEAFSAFFTAQRLTKDDLDNNLAGATVGTRTQLTSGSDSDGGLDLGSGQGVTSWTVKRGDSLGSIANATASAPEAIVLLNDLQYPYISEGGGPGIAKPGDKLLVPSGASQDETAIGPPPDQADYFITDDVLYGVDLALDPDLLAEGVMEIAVDVAHGAGDADLVRGVPAVVQGIAIVLNSEAGSTTALPEVGVYQPVGSRGTVQHTLLAAVRLRDGLLVDERVDTIDEMSVVLDADVLSQEVSLSLVGGRRVGLAVPFGKASGAGSRAAR